MTHDQDDAGEDALAGIDLHMWHVPPPVAVDRPSLLVRALSPAAASAKRPRLAWIVAAIVLLNAALATLIVIRLARPPATQTTMTVEPAGGGSVDLQVRELLQRLEKEQRELERKLAEIQELRALVVELSEKVRQYEQRDRTVPKQPARQPPARIEREPAVVGTCDEVSCMLSNYEPTCCTKFRSPGAWVAPKDPPATALPDLNRHSISDGIAAVKPRIAACADQSPAKGQVKVGVRVAADGLVTSVDVERTPDAALGACVAAAVRQAVFPRTNHGGSFSYPFVF